MGSFLIKGGKPLKGSLTPQGAKNEALQVISATLLTSEKVTIENIPNIRDVNKLMDLIKCLGVTVTQVDKSTYIFQAENINFEYLRSEEFTEKAEGLRGSIMIMGPLLSRYGKGYIPKPGGDKIGRRRLDVHLQGFKNLGVKCHYSHREDFYTIEGADLTGASMLLEEASVTGTANIVMAAVLAKGKTV